MRRIDENTVELTWMEMRASEAFDLQLDKGKGIPEAVEWIRQQYTHLDPDFYAYLAS